MKYSFLLLAASGILFGACNKKSGPEKEPAAAQVITPKPAFVASDSFKTGLGKVYAGYLAIEDALAHDEFNKATDALQSMPLLLQTVPAKGLDTAATASWDTLSAKFTGVLRPMASSTDIASMRDRFADVTPLMVDAIEKFGVASSDPMFLFHCPMAKNGQGADWLQKDKNLVNPFFGKAMAECGEFKHEIKM